MADDFVSVEIAARHLGLPVAWLRNEVRAGRLPALRAGRRIYCRLETIRRSLDERAASAPANATAPAKPGPSAGDGGGR